MQWWSIFTTWQEERAVKKRKIPNPSLQACRWPSALHNIVGWYVFFSRALFSFGRLGVPKRKRKWPWAKEFLCGFPAIGRQLLLLSSEVVHPFSTRTTTKILTIRKQKVWLYYDIAQRVKAAHKCGSLLQAGIAKQNSWLVSTIFCIVTWSSSSEEKMGFGFLDSAKEKPKILRKPSSSSFCSFQLPPWISQKTKVEESKVVPA